MTSRVIGVLALCAGLVVSGSMGAQEAPSAGPARVTVLNEDTVVRTFFAFKTPVVIKADGSFMPAEIPGRTPKRIPDYQSPLPDPAWRSVDFNDSAWPRGRAPLEMDRGSATGRSLRALHTATPNSLICARAKFIVDDPAKVKDLELSLEYIGGAAVCVNGREIARGHLPEGDLKPDTLARNYPDDLYVLKDGKYLQQIKLDPKGFARRYRRLTDVAIPADALRKGVNVLAVEIHRAPVNEAATKAQRWPEGGMYRVPGLWAYAGLRDLTLTAAPGSAVQPNVARPKGVQVWNCRPFETIEAIHYGDPGEPIRPIEINATRNGVFSGRFIVSSDTALAGLEVTMGALKQTGGSGAIPLSAVRLRYARPAVGSESWNLPFRFDGLLDTIPAEVPVIKTRLPQHRYLGTTLPRTNLSSGALAPIWITIRVPRDAKAGRYLGNVTVRAEGLEPTTVPVHLTVHDWVLPDPKDFRQRHLGNSSPDSLALRYGVPYWSDRHFELIRQSLALMAEVNSRQVHADLAIAFHGGVSNRESLVRWIKGPDGSYTHDFTVLDKYLDAVEKAIGKPLPIRFNCWGEVSRKTGNTWANVKTVSLLDPQTGTLSPLEQPPPGTDESYRFWKPVLQGVRKRVEARGWWEVTSLGHNSYCWPRRPPAIDVAHRIWPDGVWSYSAHNGKLGGAFGGSKKGVSMPIYYSEAVWTEGRLSARGYRSMVEPRKRIWNSVARNRHQDTSHLIVMLRIPEEMIMRGHDGLGQIGVDLFPIPNPERKGRYYRLSPGRGGISGNSTKAILSPGKDGAKATERFEMFREGVELCEAILFLQRALDANTISGDLAKRVNACLDARSEAFLRHWRAGRSQRDEQLLALAAEVADAAKKPGR